MIISVRGTHGSGKSTVVRSVMSAASSCRPIFGALGPKRPEAYALTLPGVSMPTFVLGPYLSVCGGCDALPNNATVMALIERYGERGHVLFEGSLISSCFGAVGSFVERWGKNSVFVFLDTPLEECLKRVEARRRRERDERLIKNVTGKYQSGWRVHRKVLAEGKMRAIVASCENAPKVLLQLLQH